MNRNGKEEVMNKTKNWEQNKKACGNGVLKALKSCLSRVVVMGGAQLKWKKNMCWSLLFRLGIMRCGHPSWWLLAVSCFVVSSSCIASLALEKWVLSPVSIGWIVSYFTGTHSAFLAPQKGFRDKDCHSYLLLFYFLILSQNDCCLLWLCLSLK